jgi:tRNA pseudouridine38-40 synthase
MRNIKLIIAYEGSKYLGWQKTSMGPNIEGVLESALKQLLQEEVPIQACSRTDAGVHAQGQVVNFLTRSAIPLKGLGNGLNALLPKEIRVLSLEEMPLSFHPTLDALSKTYHYHVCTGPIQMPFVRHLSWHTPYLLDLVAMREAAQCLLGRHDFKALCNYRKGLRYEDYVREVLRLEITPLPDRRLRFEIEGSSFLYKMVRNIVGTLVYVGRGKLTVADVPLILTGKQRSAAGITAPSHGLTLAHIRYKIMKT